MRRLIYLLLALISAGVFVYYAWAGVQEWNRGGAAADALEEVYTGETKGKKIAQERYIKYYIKHVSYYRATFVYEVDGVTYQAKSDTGMEPWNEEEVHYDPANPAKSYVGQYAPQDDDSGTCFGVAVVALVIAIVCAAGVCGYF